MRFFTDNFFTEEQKVQMLGSAYGEYAREQRRQVLLEQTRVMRMLDVEQESALRFKRQKQLFNRITLLALFIVVAMIMAYVFAG